MSYSRSQKLPCPPSMPSSLGTCFTITVSARPVMKPTITNSEKNCATRPSLSNPARIAISPASTASAAVSRMNSGVSGAAIRLTVANDIVAIIADTATTS